MGKDRALGGWEQGFAAALEQISGDAVDGPMVMLSRLAERLADPRAAAKVAAARAVPENLPIPAADPAGSPAESRAPSAVAKARVEFERLVADVALPEEMRDDAIELLCRKKKVDGHLVTPEEMAKACVALAEFNRLAESMAGIGASLRSMVMRIRERPSMDAAKHVRLVQSAWRLKWWERSGRGDRPTPAVIYGNAGVFEQVVQDAIDEAKGTVRERRERPTRFSRED